MLFPSFSPSSDALYSSISLRRSVTVGTPRGSKSAHILVFIGTQTRPVPGCTTKGLFSKWFKCLLTSISNRGYVYSRTMSCLASSRALESRALLAPVFARVSISAHLEVEARPGTELHFFRRASFKVLSGSNWSSRSNFSSVSQGS